MIRDNALAAAGLLKLTVGGPPVYPYEMTEAFKPMGPSAGDAVYRAQPLHELASHQPATCDGRLRCTEAGRVYLQTRAHGLTAPGADSTQRRAVCRSGARAPARNCITMRRAMWRR